MHRSLQCLATTPLLAPAYRVIRRRRVLQRVKAYEGRTVQHSYAGVRLTVALRDPLAEGWYDHDWPAQPELDLLTRHGRLSRGANVFDLGAHQAVVALICAAHVGDGMVVAVEAEPHNVVVARENARLNAQLPLTVVHAAVAAEVGTLWFSEGLNGAVRAGGRAGKVAVPAVTIDELSERHGHPDVVLVDVEGFEGRALEGATGVLAAARTDFFVEIHDAETLGPNGWTSRRVTEHLQTFGAEIWIGPAYEGAPEAMTLLADSRVDWDRRLYCVALFRQDAPSSADGDRMKQ